ncbi:MAG: hypothetical protein KatS3mg096_032 [Candidatus Parcubacteria bacterium]|nr:MAG: hypothetical protein KatS3mg096_032 [Candidatus Parcubacteria bacterium]
MKKPEKKDLIKVSDYIWEIPQSFREDMKVPARIFASEKMLDDILEDKSLWQLVNMATLPGAYKYALAMPDVHEGYGFCLIKGTKILSSYGYYLNIEDFEKIYKNEKICLFDKSKAKLVKANILRFYKLKPYNKIFKLTTKSGLEITATQDHPIFTWDGMKKIEDLKIGDEVLVCGFEGVHFEKPGSEIIVDEKSIKETFNKINPSKSKNSLKIIIKKLKEKNLIPLTYDNPKLPEVIKILAFIFGDGSMNFIGKKKDGVLSFVGEKEDLLEIKEDLSKIGYHSSKIYRRIKDGKYKAYEFYVNASSLLILLASLGAPLGNKVNQKYRVPKWIFKAPLWQKRLFLATLFGCELRTPHRRLKRRFGFDSPVYPMNKRIDLVKNGLDFLNDIAKLCQEFGVETTKINKRRLIKDKNGNLTISLELVFSSKLESLLNLWSKIGYEYNRGRMAKASIYSIYLRAKKKILLEREKLIYSIFQFLNSGLSYQKIGAKLKNELFTQRWIEDVCYRLNNNLNYLKPKVPTKFISLRDFVKTKALSNSGFCFDEIEKIEEVDYSDYVYDLTVNHQDHNFIANNFVVSNCVGGVLATDLGKEGTVSPGGVGFDINCLHPDTLVNLENGTYLEIKDLNKDFEVYLLNKKKKKLEKAKIILNLKRKETKLLKIKTKFGNEILITPDHPIYTLFGMKEAKNLEIGEKILTYPFKGVKYEKPKRILILSKEKFIEFCTKNGITKKGNQLAQITNYLERKNLLPLYSDSFVFPYIIKIFAYALGDGNIPKNFNHLSLWGQLGDLKLIKKDLEKIGVNSIIVKRKKKHKLINTYGKNCEFERTEYCLRISKSFALLLGALGYPIGKKTEVEFKLPYWLKKLPLWQKRLFLASFFGAELSSPSAFHKFNLSALVLNINKNKKLVNNGLEFMQEIRDMLKEFGIETSEIKVMEELGIKNKTIGLRFQIKSEPKNLIRFFEAIGFEYNQEKQKLSNLALAYLKYKEKIKNQRQDIRNKIKEYYLINRVSKRELVKVFSSEFINERFIERSIWEGASEVRIAFNFLSFKDFIKFYSYGDFVIDEIEGIEEINYSGYVYDLTIDHPDHNFIANNIVVSNCGVRLLVSPFYYEEIKDKIPKLTEQIFKEVPSGVGRGGFWRLNNNEMKKVLEEGAKWLYEIGYATKEDLEATESYGKIEGADSDRVSKTAKDRGRDQLGTIGAGNHFVEIQRVAEIFPAWSTDKNEEIAKKLGLEKNKVCVLIHCGSRGLGHQVATDYIREALRYLDKQGIDLVDRELAYFPYSHELGQAYLSAMKASANFAFANRQLITYEVRKAFKKVFGKEIELKQVYDVAHNIVKIEEYDNKKLLVHRKGATRAFWQGHSELPEKYRQIGQPTLIPGSMGTSSYVLIGQELAKEISFGSAPHGAGRMMSRAEAKRKIRGSELKKELEGRGISVAAGSMSGLAEEAPIAYKDVSAVVDVVHNIGIAKKVVKLVPIGVIKG